MQTSPTQSFLDQLASRPIMKQRIELACEDVGFEAGIREILHLAREIGLALTHEEASAILDEIAGL